MAAPRPLDGACLCGGVQYVVRLDAEPIDNVVCHCYNCHKQTGSAFLTATVFKKADVEVLNTRGHLKSFADTATDSTKPLHRYFCGNCGSSIYAINPRSEEIIIIFAGTFNDPDRFGTPFREQYVECRSHWIPSFDQLTHSRHNRGETR